MTLKLKRLKLPRGLGQLGGRDGGVADYLSAATLDDISVYAAIALKKVYTAFSGDVITLRRSSDNAEASFGFRGDGWLDVVAILAWAGADTIYVKEVKDQTGNAHHAQQSTTSAQPKLVISGGLPEVYYDDSAQYLDLASSVAFGNAVGYIGMHVAGKVRNQTNSSTFVYAPTPTATTPRARLYSDTTGRTLLDARRLDAGSASQITGVTTSVDVWSRHQCEAAYAAAATGYTRTNGKARNGTGSNWGTGNTSATDGGGAVRLGRGYSTSIPLVGSFRGVVLTNTSFFSRSANDGYKAARIDAVLDELCTNVRRNVIECYGDSLTYGFPNSLADSDIYSYPAVLQASLANNRAIINAGISAQSASSIVSRVTAEPDFPNRVVILWAGRNNAADMSGVLDQIDAAYAAVSSRRVIFGTVITATDETEGTGNWNRITAYNDALKAKYGNRVVDIQQILIDASDPVGDATQIAGKTPGTSLRDGDLLHLTDAAYDIVADTFQAKIESLGW